MQRTCLCRDACADGIGGCKGTGQAECGIQNTESRAEGLQAKACKQQAELENPEGNDDKSVGMQALWQEKYICPAERQEKGDRNHPGKSRAYGYEKREEDDQKQMAVMQGAREAAFTGHKRTGYTRGSGWGRDGI